MNEAEYAAVFGTNLFLKSNLLFKQDHGYPILLEEGDYVYVGYTWEKGEKRCTRFDKCDGLPFTMEPTNPDY